MENDHSSQDPAGFLAAVGSKPIWGRALFAAALALGCLTGRALADTVAFIDPAARVISVKMAVGFKGYRLAERVDVRIEGAAGTIEQIKAGDNVVLSLVDSQTVSRIAAGVGVKPPASAGMGMRPPERKITVRMKVDGGDVIRVKDGLVWIEHRLWEMPEELAVNGRSWRPKWDGQKSSAFYGFDGPLVPFDGATVKVQKTKGRGEVKVKEMPSAANGQTLLVDIDDGSQGGSDLYEVQITW